VKNLTRLEFILAVNVNTNVCWDVTPCIDISEEAASSFSMVPYIKATGSCALSVHIYNITQCHIPGEINLRAKYILQFLGYVE
jgi:hypothetical protein